MSVFHDSDKNIFTLRTRRTLYQMRVSPRGYLLHIYYGRNFESKSRSETSNQADSLDYLYLPGDHGFTTNPYELKTERKWSMDVLPMEYSAANTGDFRLSALNCSTRDGVWGADLRYTRHEILPGKYNLTGLPSAFDREGNAETLSVILTDKATGIEVNLLYAVFEEQDVITRAVKIKNAGNQDIYLRKAASACLDMPFGDWDLIYFYGRHTMERQTRRESITPGIKTISSRRGISSHQQNPFVILCGKNSTEDFGDCYGVMPVYSGNHKTEIEQDQLDSIRIVTGIHDEQFTWKLNPGEIFAAPEIIFAYTHQGLSELSRIYHNFIRNNIIKSKYPESSRPVLLNNWEATYFDFNTDKLLNIASQAKSLGVDTLVLDDGWFGTRNDDNQGLGDWFVNEKKLPGGFDYLIPKIHEMGLKFGLWIEPESVNENSDLYRSHPDWALTVPGRNPAMGRNQLVLDFSRQDVIDYLYHIFADILKKYNINYIKWDMNRCLTDVYSHAFPADRQGEIFHRYVLGLYRLLDQLTSEFPDVLFEGCAGGGGRFDAGMLYYCPQIWCSDDTDAIERLTIQYGTSFGYPPCTMGAHVSAAPNHQTGRETPIGTRAVVAMAGTFGYELDFNKLSEQERDEVRRQIQDFHQYDALNRDGDYYRLALSKYNHRFTAWEFAAPDQSEALVSVVVTHTTANAGPIYLKLKGLDESAYYELKFEFFGNLVPADQIYGGSRDGQKSYSGAALMYAGLTIPPLFGDYPSARIYLKKI